MTREEVIAILTEYRKKLINSVSNQLDKDIEAFDMAIQALENEEEVYMRGYEQGRIDLFNAIGKAKAEIRATIDEEKIGNGNINKGVVIGLQMTLDIIDKYKAESEEV